MSDLTRDVRDVLHRDRHPKTHDTFADLQSGESLRCGPTSTLTHVPSHRESDSPVLWMGFLGPDVMSESAETRRRFLQLSGAMVATTAIAGCTGGSGSQSGGGDSDGDGDGGGDGDGSDGDGSDGGSSGSDGEGSGSGGGEFDGWFDNVGNYEGVVDATGEDEVTVTVGAEGNGGTFAFDPAAFRVDSGTTVVWEWTGDGGGHDVVAEDGSFESDLQSDAGATFEHDFEEAGTYRYACTPHKSMGMKGAVVVE
jgi:halocyanin-like protein